MAEERKLDRRVAYTKLVLRKALLELMQSQHISEITITSLCELADINRSTFYLHYRDQYDLLHKIEEEVLIHVAEIMATAQDSAKVGIAWTPVTREMILAILDYAKENYSLARILFGKNCDFNFQQDILDLIKKLVPFPESPLDKRTIDIIMTHAINGGLDLLERWIFEGAIEDPAVIADVMLKLIYSGTTSFNSSED